jgi:hypothetical protein
MWTDYDLLVETTDNTANDEWHTLAELSQTSLSTAMSNRTTGNFELSLSLLKFRALLLQILCEFAHADCAAAIKSVGDFEEQLNTLATSSLFDSESVAFWQVFVGGVRAIGDAATLIASINGMSSSRAAGTQCQCWRGAANQDATRWQRTPLLKSNCNVAFKALSSTIRL